MTTEVWAALAAMALSAAVLTFSRVARTLVLESLKNWSRRTEITVEGPKVLEVKVKDHLGLRDGATGQTRPPAEG